MIYIHIPFCKSFCTYCDFYSELASRPQQEFSKALSREIRYSADILKEHSNLTKVKTIYIGGGTPSVLPLFAITEAVATLKECGYNPPYDEFTLEVNPEDIVEKGLDYLEALQELGVNRISMGVQSFDDEILKWMNRRHTAETAVKAYNLLEKAGIDNISIDLIFGLPQLDESKWKETINKALNISKLGNLPKHISAYQLSIEPTSALAGMLEKGEFVEASDEDCRSQYDILCTTLGDAGYNHYEISNFALPRYEAVHNSSYWKHIPYLGFGPAAHSYIAQNGKHIRRWNIPDLHEYIKAGKLRDFSIVREEEVLTEEQIILEKIMLGLRTSRGVEAVILVNYNPEKTEKLLHEGKLIYTQKGYIRIPEQYFFISDSIIASLCQ